jgi:hypothetical protein
MWIDAVGECPKDTPRVFARVDRPSAFAQGDIHVRMGLRVRSKLALKCVAHLPDRVKLAHP